MPRAVTSWPHCKMHSCRNFFGSVDRLEHRLVLLMITSAHTISAQSKFQADYYCMLVSQVRKCQCLRQGSSYTTAGLATHLHRCASPHSLSLVSPAIELEHMEVLIGEQIICSCAHCLLYLYDLYNSSVNESTAACVALL
eukprot:3160-Heterococcus_DN1.PRE.6